MITVSHGCFVGDALDFLNWRVLLARAAGHGVVPMQIEEVTLLVPSVRDVDLDIDKVLGVWDQTPEDILAVLLGHCDDDGMIYPVHLIPLAERLDDLLPVLAEHSEHPTNSPAQLVEVQITKQFIAGLISADAANEAITFSSED